MKWSGGSSSGREMNRKVFEKALKQRRIRRWKRGPALVKKDLRAAKKDLISAEESLKRKNFKWATIQGGD